jgi:hypothetical protein
VAAQDRLSEASALEREAAQAEKVSAKVAYQKDATN